jgi:hypothetical protein
VGRNCSGSIAGGDAAGQGAAGALEQNPHVQKIAADKSGDAGVFGDDRAKK